MNMPNQNVPVIDPTTGALNKQWLQFFSQLNAAVGDSLTANQDAELLALYTSAPAAASGAGGGVSSVSLTDASTVPIFATSSSGSSTVALTETLVTQSANKAFMGPASGSAAEPTFRNLAYLDLPGAGIPATIPDLQLWFESDNINASTGGLVSKLQERTPWMTGISCPSGGTGVTANAASINGLPTIKWPASAGTGFNITPNLTQAATAGIGTTFFYVLNPNSFAAVQALVGTGNGGLALYQNGVAGTAKVSLVKGATGVIASATATFTAGTAFQGNATYFPTTGAFAFRQSRTAAGSGTGLTAAGFSCQFIGSDSGTSTAVLNQTSLAAILIYNRLLTSGEITAVENYLFAKWGV